MGGHKGGAAAAEIAIRKVEEILSKPFRDARKVLKQAFTEANTSLKDHVEKNPYMHGMGATLSVLLYFRDFAYSAHIGDSRVYRFNDDGVTRISTDHSMVQELIRLGALTEIQAVHHPDSNILTRALTAGGNNEPDVYDPIPVEKGDAYLACTDGLWKILSDDDISRIVLDMDAQDAADSLVELAVQQGSDDDTTACVMKIE